MNYPKHQMIKDYLKKEITQLQDKRETVKSELKYYADYYGFNRESWFLYLRKTLAQINKDLKVLSILAKENKQDIACQVAINKFANKTLQDAPIYHTPIINADNHKWEEMDPSELINYDDLPSL